MFSFNLRKLERSRLRDRFLLWSCGMHKIDILVSSALFIFRSSFKTRDYDLREPIPHTWASSHDNLFQSNFSAWASREAILGTPPDWPI